MRIRYATGRHVLPLDSYQRREVVREYRHARLGWNLAPWEARTRALQLAFYIVAMSHPGTVDLPDRPSRP